jgi:cellulose synthase (UDP-forming)
MAFWWRKQQWLRPVDVKMPNWEGTLFLFARWPWSLIGTIAAVRDWIRGSTLEFRVTPKGRAAAEPLPFRILAPYAFLSVASGLPPVLLIGHVKIAVGFYLFAAMNSLLYATLLLVIIIMHRRENPAPLCSDRLSSVIEPLLGSISTAPVRAPVAMACHRTSRKREEELVN